jgi:hypothetical protein
VEHNADPFAPPTEASSPYADLRDEYQQRMAKCRTFDDAAELVHEAFIDPAVMRLPTHQHEAIQAACVVRRNELAGFSVPTKQTTLIK